MPVDVSFAELLVPPYTPPAGAINGGGRITVVPAPITGRVTALPVPSRAAVGLPALLMSREQLQAVMARGVPSRRRVGRPMVQASNRWIVMAKGIGRKTV